MHRATISSPGAATEVAFTMRIKLVWRIVFSTLALLLSIASIVAGHWQLWMCAAAAILLAACSLHDQISLEDGVVYRRYALTRAEPVVLAELTSVTLARVWEYREPYPHVVLLLDDGHRHPLAVSLRWWSDTDALTRVVASAVAASRSGEWAQRRWRLDLDRQTSRRLAAALPSVSPS